MRPKASRARAAGLFLAACLFQLGFLGLLVLLLYLAVRYWQATLVYCAMIFAIEFAGQHLNSRRAAGMGLGASRSKERS